MLERYGTYAAELLAALPVAQHPLEHAPGYSREEIAFLAEREEVVNLMDLLLRRTSVAFVGGMSAATLQEIAAAAAPALGWDASRVRAEVELATTSLRDAHRVELGHAGVAALTH